MKTYTYTNLQVIRELERMCRHRTQKSLARDLGVSLSYLNECITGRKVLGPKLLDALGYERQVVYVKTWRK